MANPGSQAEHKAVRGWSCATKPIGNRPNNADHLIINNLLTSKHSIPRSESPELTNLLNQ